MGRSQLLIWIVSFFSAALLWGVSAEVEDVAAEAEAILTEAALLAEAQNALDIAFNSLPEDVQDELRFKRLMIGIIDQGLEVNEALGFDSSNAWHRVGIALPAWMVIGGTYHGQRGLMSNIKSITPDKRAKYKELFKESARLTQDLSNKQNLLDAEKRALDKLQEEHSKAAQSQDVSQENKQAAKTAEESVKTVSQENKQAAKTTEEPVKTVSQENKQAAKVTEESVKAEPSKKKAQRRRVSTPKDLTAQIKRKETHINNLQAQVDQMKTQVKNLPGLKTKNLFYRVGRLIRFAGMTTVFLAGVPIYVMAIGETVLVMFDMPADLEALKEQYVQDIEEVMNFAVEEAS